jgi:hypothetical protein
MTNEDNYVISNHRTRTGGNRIQIKLYSTAKEVYDCKSDYFISLSLSLLI